MYTKHRLVYYIIYRKIIRETSLKFKKNVYDDHHYLVDFMVSILFLCKVFFTHLRYVYTYILINDNFI